MNKKILIFVLIVVIVLAACEKVYDGSKPGYIVCKGTDIGWQVSGMPFKMKDTEDLNIIINAIAIDVESNPDCNNFEYTAYYDEKYDWYDIKRKADCRLNEYMSGRTDWQEDNCEQVEFISKEIKCKKLKKYLLDM